MPARKQKTAPAPAAPKQRAAAPAAKRVRNRAKAAAPKAPAPPVVVAATPEPEPAASATVAGPGPFAPQVSEDQAKTIADRIVAAVVGAERAQHPARPADIRAGMQVFVRMAAGQYGGEPMERGRLFRLKGLPGDEKMVRLGYFVRYVPDLHGKVKTCRLCPAEFVTERDRDGHGARVHEKQERAATLDLSRIPERDQERAKAEFSAQEGRREELREEREDERMMRESPPMLENSTASLHASA